MYVDYVTKDFMICTHHRALFLPSDLEEWNGRGMWHICEEERPIVTWGKNGMW